MTAELLQTGVEYLIAGLSVILLAGLMWKLYKGRGT